MSDEPMHYMKNTYRKVDSNQFLQTILILLDLNENNLIVPVKDELKELIKYKEAKEFLNTLEPPKESVFDRTERLIYAPFDLHFTLQPEEEALIPLGVFMPMEEALIPTLWKDRKIACENLLLRGKFGDLGSVLLIRNHSDEEIRLDCARGQNIIKAINRKAYEQLLKTIMEA